MKKKELVIPVVFHRRNFAEKHGYISGKFIYQIINSDCSLGRKFKSVLGFKDGMKLEIVVRKRRD